MGRSYYIICFHCKHNRKITTSAHVHIFHKDFICSKVICLWRICNINSICLFHIKSLSNHSKANKEFWILLKRSLFNSFYDQKCWSCICLQVRYSSNSYLIYLQTFTENWLALNLTWKWNWFTKLLVIGFRINQN